MLKKLLSPDPAEGGDPSSTPPNPQPKPPQPPQAPPEPPGPASPPPAAKIVLEGEKTEKELALERKLKERETRLSELEDENHQLKTPAQNPPSPAREKKKSSWLSGATFFED